jgi:hypothetical protein
MNRRQKRRKPGGGLASTVNDTGNASKGRSGILSFDEKITKFPLLTIRLKMYFPFIKTVI